jgi:hypothetical protein
VQGQTPQETANAPLTNALFSQNRKYCISEKTAHPTRLDKGLQSTDVPKIEQLNIRLPEFGADVRRNS